MASNRFEALRKIPQKKPVPHPSKYKGRPHFLLQERLTGALWRLVGPTSGIWSPHTLSD